MRDTRIVGGNRGFTTALAWSTTARGEVRCRFQSSLRRLGSGARHSRNRPTTEVRKDGTRLRSSWCRSPCLASKVDSQLNPNSLPTQALRHSAPLTAPIPSEVPHLRYAQCDLLPGTLAWRTQLLRRVSLSQNVRYRGIEPVRSASLFETPLLPRE